MAGWEYRQATGRGAQVLSSATDQRAVLRDLRGHDHALSPALVCAGGGAGARPRAHECGLLLS